MNGSPVPVPKESLFKTGPVKAKAKAKSLTADMVIAQAAAAQIAEQIGASTKTYVGVSAPAAQGVPLIKAKTVKTTATVMVSGVTSVVIPLALAESILSKPSTGGGWQTLMGELQKALVKMAETVEDPAASHVLYLSPVLLGKLIDKATLYGPGGGYQGVMKSIVCLAVKQHPGQVLKGGA